MAAPPPTLPCEASVTGSLADLEIPRMVKSGLYDLLFFVLYKHMWRTTGVIHHPHVYVH